MLVGMMPILPLLGASKILHALRKEWEGSIKCVFQPAEEQYPGGAQQMIKKGVLKSNNLEVPGKCFVSTFF